MPQRADPYLHIENERNFNLLVGHLKKIKFSQSSVLDLQDFLHVFESSEPYPEFKDPDPDPANLSAPVTAN